MESLNSTDTDRPQRVAVVSAADGGKECPVLASPGLLAMRLYGNFKGGLDSCGAAIRVENFREAFRDSLDQHSCQFDRWRRTETEKCGMTDSIELLANRLVNLRNTVTMDVTPQRRCSVEIAVSLNVDHLKRIARFDDRCVLLAVGLHGCKGMPDMGVIPVAKLAWSRLMREIHTTMNFQYRSGAW
mgnify:CR=1 FL=1